VSRLAKFFAGNDPEKKQYGRIHDRTDIRPVPIFFCNILFYPFLLRQTAIGSFRIKTVFLKYIMWDFLKITIIQYADVVTVTYRRIVAVQALDEKT